jgi:hypothetical protein
MKQRAEPHCPRRAAPPPPRSLSALAHRITTASASSCNHHLGLLESGVIAFHDPPPSPLSGLAGAGGSPWPDQCRASPHSPWLVLESPSPVDREASSELTSTVVSLRERRRRTVRSAMAAPSFSSIFALPICLFLDWIRVPGFSGVHLDNRMTSSTNFISLACNALAPTELPWPP